LTLLLVQTPLGKKAAKPPRGTKLFLKIFIPKQNMPAAWAMVKTGASGFSSKLQQQDWLENTNRLQKNR
jgi:hypothetical protein